MQSIFENLHLRDRAAAIPSQHCRRESPGLQPCQKQLEHAQLLVFRNLPEESPVDTCRQQHAPAYIVNLRRREKPRAEWRWDAPACRMASCRKRRRSSSSCWNKVSSHATTPSGVRSSMRPSPARARNGLARRGCGAVRGKGSYWCGCRASTLDACWAVAMVCSSYGFGSCRSPGFRHGTKGENEGVRAGDCQARESRARSCSRMRGGDPTRAAHQAFPSRSQSSSRTRERITCGGISSQSSFPSSYV